MRHVLLHALRSHRSCVTGSEGADGEGDSRVRFRQTHRRAVSPTATDVLSVLVELSSAMGVSGGSLSKDTGCEVGDFCIFLFSTGVSRRTASQQQLFNSWTQEDARRSTFTHQMLFLKKYMNIDLMKQANPIRVIVKKDKKCMTP